MRAGLSDKGRELLSLDIENEMKDYFISTGKVKANKPSQPSYPVKIIMVRIA